VCGKTEGGKRNTPIVIAIFALEEVKQVLDPKKKKQMKQIRRH